MIGDPDAADRFFDAPRVDDPFAPPPPLAPLDALAPQSITGLELGSTPVPAGPPATFDPFAPPNVPPIDPFGTTPTTDPWGDPDGFEALDEPPLRHPDLATFVVDFGPSAEASDPPAPAIEPATATGAHDAVDWEVLDPFAVLAHESGGGADPHDGPEIDADDPFAILRMPLDELPDDDLAVADQFGADPNSSLWRDADPFGPEHRDVEVVFEPMPEPPPIDPFAGAFEPVDTVLQPLASPEASAPIEPDDAYDAVDAHEPDDAYDAVDAHEPDDMYQTVDAHEIVDAHEVVEVFEATEPVAAEPTTEPLAEPTELLAGVDAGEPTDEWFDRAAAAAHALVAEQHEEAPADDAALAPIAWSLSPPGPDAMDTADDAADAMDTADDAADADATVVAEAAEGAETWVAAGPNWEIGGIFPATALADDGALALRRADVRWALADVVATGDFALRATVNFTSGAGFGILFRVSVDDRERITGYSFDFDPIYSGGGFVLRQWNDSKQHWKPLAHAPVADSSRLYGPQTIEVTLRADHLVATVDGDIVLTVDGLSRVSIDSGREPCRGERIGVQAWSTTEVTVDRLLVASA
jgi:hypothetical protein